MKITQVAFDPYVDRIRLIEYEVEVVAYNHFEKSGHQLTKPDKGGFVVVKYSVGETGMIPLRDVINFDELPEKIKQ